MTEPHEPGPRDDQPDDKNQPGDPDQPSGQGGDQPQPHTQRIQHQSVSARVPEEVGRGVFSTGALVLGGRDEFIIDFVQAMARPHRVVARVVASRTCMQRLLATLTENLQKYQQRFASPPSAPQGASPPPSPPSIEDIYAQLKLPDELLSGVYANAVMIGHSPHEFCLDFITAFYPQSAVTCRVFMASANVPRLAETLRRSIEGPPQGTPGSPGEGPTGPSPTSDDPSPGPSAG
jgi:hypothetical protein